MRGAALLILLLALAAGAEPLAKVSSTALEPALFIGETSVLSIAVAASQDLPSPVTVALDATASAGKLKVYRIDSRSFSRRTIPCSDTAFNRHATQGVTVRKGATTFLFAVQPCEDVPVGDYTLEFRLEGAEVVREMTFPVKSPLAWSVSGGAPRTGGEGTITLTLRNQGSELLEDVMVEVANPLPGKLVISPERVRLEDDIPLKASAQVSFVVNASHDTPATSHPVGMTFAYRTFETVTQVREPVGGLLVRVSQGEAPKPELEVRDPLDINTKAPVFSSVLGVPFDVVLPLKNTGAGHAAECAIDITLPKGVFVPLDLSTPHEFRTLAIEDVVHLSLGDIAGRGEGSARITLLPLVVPTTAKGTYKAAVSAQCLNMAHAAVRAPKRELVVALDLPSPEFELDADVPDTVVGEEGTIGAVATLRSAEELSCTLRAAWPVYLRYRPAAGRGSWSADARVNGTYEKAFEFEPSNIQRSTSEHDLVFSATCKNALNVTGSRERRVALMYKGQGAGMDDVMVWAAAGLLVLLVALAAILRLLSRGKKEPEWVA